MAVGLSYNPFGCALKEIKPKQLDTLREVAEGWYVEYKGALVPAKTIAKSLAAFANHYGGWIFYGISGSRDGRNVAVDFPGLTKPETKSLLEWLQAAAKDIINPSPFFEYHIVDGPSPEIGLESEKSIVIVTVPSGADGPYIHNDGKIYRRVADASDPKPETDKSTLDLLWQRGRKARTALADFLKKKPVLSKGEEDLTFIDVFLMPDPLGGAKQHSQLKFERFVELMSDTDSLACNIACDNFFSMSDGFIGRHVADNNPYNLTLTWKYYRSSTSIISLPFSSAQIGELPYSAWLDGYKYKDEFLAQLNTDFLAASHLLDLNQLLILMFAVMGRQRQLMEASGVRSPVYAKVAINNCWRRVPFLDTKPYLDFVIKHGIPVIQFNRAFAPPDTTYESLRLIEIDYNKSASDTQVENAAQLTFDILNALGLPTYPDLFEELSILELMKASQRASEVSKLRSQHMRA